MKNKQLKHLISQKMAFQSANHKEVTLLNRDELNYALGGAQQGCNCPMLTSCGDYCNCKVKLGVVLD